VVEQHQNDAAENEHTSERRKIVESDAGNPMSTPMSTMIFVFPGVDEEAVEAAKRREDERSG
jgi:hypothetical protein